MADDHPYPLEARHEWKAFVAYNLTDEQAYKLVHGPTGDKPLVPIHPEEEHKIDPSLAVLRVDMVDSSLSHVGCFRCETAHQFAAGYPCPGDPVDHMRLSNGGVEPVYEIRHEPTGEVRRVTWDRWVELHEGKP